MRDLIGDAASRRGLNGAKQNQRFNLPAPRRQHRQPAMFNPQECLIIAGNGQLLCQ